MQPELDVAILGSGLAANLLARQLGRQVPGLRVAMIERERATSFKVGEATVELFTNYMLRKLGLSTYLYEQQLPKNGLRFFFDRATRDAALEEMTEMGSQSLPYHPSFQLDRQRLEADLQRMNVTAGVGLRAGTVRDLELTDGSTPHRFSIEHEGGTRSTHTARWVVDATGRSSLIAKHKGLRVPIKHHQVASAWARYRGVRDIDDLGGPGFRERVRCTPRRLSTIHFAYPGYWIWFIPLGEGVLSVGVVIDKTSPHYDARILHQDGFTAFLREHRAVASLLEHVEPLDFMAYGQLAYGTTKVLSGSERWGTTGVAAAFTDPFYSPGSDFIALANDFLCDLITRDFAGAGTAEVTARGNLYDEYMLYRYRANMLLYQDQYPAIGAFPLMRLKWDFDIQCYYDLWLNSYMQDHHLDETRLRGDLRERTFVLNMLTSFGQLFAAIGRHLHTKGTYFAHNVGEFCEPLERVGCVKHVGKPMPLAATQERILGCMRTVRRRAFAMLDWPCDEREPTFVEFVTGRAFAPPREVGQGQLEVGNPSVG
jgi:flavin-dependent dehydrogenase